MKKCKRLVSWIAAACAVILPAAIALAEDGQGGGNAISTGQGIMAFAIAFGIGLAAFGGAFGQSRAASAALEGISRNPNASDKVFVPMILGLAFIESLVLFTWVLMFLMMGKL